MALTSQPKRRYLSGSVSVRADVDVDLADLMRQVGDADLLAECEARRLTGKLPGSPDLEEAARRVRRGDLERALMLIEEALPHPFRLFAAEAARLRGAH